MTWREGHVWTAVAALPPGVHEFKVVVKRGDGSLQWEDGENRSVTVPEAVPVGQLVALDCAYGHTAATELVATVDESQLEGLEVAGLELKAALWWGAAVTPAVTVVVAAVVVVVALGALFCLEVRAKPLWLACCSVSTIRLDALQSLGSLLSWYTFL